MKHAILTTTAVLIFLGAAIGFAAESAYTVPEHLKPMTTWRNGWSAEETRKYRLEYNNNTLTDGEDDGAYAIAHLSELLPTAIVHRDGPIAKLESAPVPEIEDVIATTDLGAMTLREMMKDQRSRIRAIAVVHKGKLVYENYIGIRPWDNHIWASAAKSVVGLVSYLLEKEGKLELNQTVGHYMPQFRDTAWEHIQVADVLHQRSGLDILEAEVGDPKHPMTLFYAIFAGASGIPKGASFFDAMNSVKKLREPGQRFEYSSMNTMMMVMIAEKITKKPFHDLMTEMVWSKTGMEGDAELGLSPSGEPSAFGIFSSRLRDLARYGMLYTPSWNVVAKENIVGKDYLPKIYATAKVEQYSGNLGDRMIAHFGNLDMGASYQWDAVFPDGDLYKSGRGGQCLYVSPETDTVVVYFSASYKSTLWVHAYAREIVKQVFRKK
ncbi:MAG: beta-lactamase family protein [Desulfatitalea sp.]|nr:beta-lactamase family protein [Desulfatitalea sp.]